MTRLMVSAVVVGLALAGCDYGDPRLPLPPGDVGQDDVPTDGGDVGGVDAGEESTNIITPDAGQPAEDGGVTGDGGVFGTIAEVARSDGELELFMRAIELAGMTAALDDARATLTVFAPDNAAFTALLTELGVSPRLEGLSVEQLQAILRYHVLPARVTMNDAVAAAGLTPLETQGGRLQVSVDRAQLRLDERASVIRADVQASNGVLHVIDRVLLPSAADVLSTTTSLESFNAALMMADGAASAGLAKRLDDDSQSLTVFAPEERGFERFVLELASAGISGLESFRADQLAPIVRYHVAEGAMRAAHLVEAGRFEGLGGRLTSAQVDTALMVDAANVLITDLYCSNGVIHVVDSVLLPSITDVLSTDRRFRALSAAMGAADAEPTLTRWLGSALDSPNEFTFFAPTDAAFNGFGSLPTGPALANTLFFHAVPGRPLYGSRVITFTAPTPLLTSIDRPLVLQSSGSPPRVTLTDGLGATASITQTDLFTSNGVIHVIDRVLVPPP